MKIFKSTLCFSIKMKVVAFEILYNSGVHSLRDKFSNDQLYPKYFLPDRDRTQAGLVQTRPDHCYYHDHHQQYHHNHDYQHAHHQHKYHKFHRWMHHNWCQQHLRNYHNGSAIRITIQMLLLTPMMMYQWMKFMLLMLMMSMLIIMIMMIILMMIMIINMIFRRSIDDIAILQLCYRVFQGCSRGAKGVFSRKNTFFI